MPVPEPGVAAELAWWEPFRVALRGFPPPAGDTALLEAAASLGLTAAHSPYVDPDPALAKRLVAARQQGDTTLEGLSTTA